MTVRENYHETVDQATRKTMLERYRHQCQSCGQKGPGAGGEARLHVHHIKRDPEECDVHDPANLTVMCRQCHFWQHQRPSDEDAPVQVSLSDADHQELLAKDIEILRVLAEHGPASTGEIADKLTSEPSVMTTRERLWTLMGLDNIVAERDAQLVDQDINSGEWGLTGQIERSARGYIPDDPQVLLQRIQDEQVRQALDRGCSRQTVVEAFGIARRTSFYQQKRARAYDFPLDAFDDGKQRPDSTQPAAVAREPPSEVADGQQRLDTLESVSAEQQAQDSESVASVAGGDPISPSVADEHNETAESASSTQDTATETESESDLRGQLQQAIEALQAIERAI